MALQAYQSSSQAKASSTQPVQKKSRKAKKKAAAVSSNFIPVPKGTSMFMFQGVEDLPCGSMTLDVVTCACRALFL